LSTGGDGDDDATVFTGSLLAAGLYFILADVLKLTTMKTAKAMLGAGKENKKAAKTAEAWLMSVAVKLSKYIRMDEYKHGRMTNVLKAAGISMDTGGILRLRNCQSRSHPAWG
jgi:hypothetical protein